MSVENQDLGHKRTCPHCGVKYYDFYQDELDCPECGKSIEAVNITKPKRGRKAGISISTVAPKTNKENDELKDLIDETDDSAVSTEEDTDNLAEDISLDISKEKTDEEAV
ncbi:TIGR02300 family protein [Alphaproteobacteria bacterium]|nr:TIGR02300 family protein [Alphaproteobacteria bacterium]